MAIANANVRSAHQISSLVGWAATPHRIFWTTNAGVEWSDITPSVSSSNISSVFFADEAHGWIVAFSGLSWSLAQTGNAGRTWQIRPLPAPTDATDYSGVSSVFFSDLNHGEIYLRLASSSNFIISLQLTSADGAAGGQIGPRYSTVKSFFVVKVPLGVVTVIGPVVAPAGTAAQMPWCEGTVKVVAGVPLKLTAVAPSRPSPNRSTRWSTLPAFGTMALTWGTGLGSPRSITKTVPSEYVPPAKSTP